MRPKELPGIPLGETDIAYAINDQAQIVGYFIHPATTNPPLFYAGGFVFMKNSQQTNVTQLWWTKYPRP